MSEKMREIGHDFSEGEVLDVGRYKGMPARIIRENEPDRVLIKVVFEGQTRYGNLPGEIYSFSSNDKVLDAKIAGAIEKIKKSPDWEMAN